MKISEYNTYINICLPLSQFHRNYIYWHVLQHRVSMQRSIPFIQSIQFDECNRQQQQVIVGKGEITPTQRIVYKTNCSPRCILLHFN